MCRIAGIIQRNSSSTELYRQVKAMCDSMCHGGPDDEGVYLDIDSPLALGHKRLALIDLSEAGHQPMSSNDNSNWIVFNGEIYNFLELRQELETAGHLFCSGSDTEVILAAYAQWGTAAFARFNGMFAFALFDKTEQQLYLVRDAAGIKPLYYSLNNDGLVFASEVKAFKHVHAQYPENPNWRLLLLSFGHMPEPFTTLEGVLALAKGTYLAYNLINSKARIEQFRQIGFSTTKVNNKEEAISLVCQKLKHAVKRHLIADAPIGSFLSGGIDSSILTLLAANESKAELHTLSVVFDEDKFSEKTYQQIIIDQIGCKHEFYKVTRTDLDGDLDKILKAYDQPSNDAINSWFISKCAHKNGLKAVLSGLGGDELFGGYPSFKRMSQLYTLRKLPAFLLSLARLAPKPALKRLEWLKLKGTLGLYLTIRGLHTPQEVAQLCSISIEQVFQTLQNLQFQPTEKDIPENEAACWLEYNQYMQNQLLKDTDYMSMQHALEVRVPFLDQEFLDAVFSIDSSLLYGHMGRPKQLLIDAFKDILPKEIWNRPKMGFSFPFQYWLGKNEQIRHNLSTNKTGSRLLKKFDQGQLHWAKLWSYYLSQHFVA